MTHKTQPLDTMLVIKAFCEDCLSVHWIEYLSGGRTKCHGEDLLPVETPTIYVKHKGGGMFEIRQKATTSPPQKTFDDWLTEAYEESES